MFNNYNRLISNFIEDIKRFKTNFSLVIDDFKDFGFFKYFLILSDTTSKSKKILDDVFTTYVYYININNLYEKFEILKSKKSLDSNVFDTFVIYNLLKSGKIIFDKDNRILEIRKNLNKKINLNNIEKIYFRFLKREVVSLLDTASKLFDKDLDSALLCSKEAINYLLSFYFNNINQNRFLYEQIPKPNWILYDLFDIPKFRNKITNILMERDKKIDKTFYEAKKIIKDLEKY